MANKKRDRWYQATEKLLYMHPSFPIRVAALREQILELENMELKVTAVYSGDGAQKSGVSEQVASMAVRVVDGVGRLERKIKNLEALYVIVERSVNTMLDEEQQRMVDLIYYKGKSWEEVCRVMGIDKNTYYDKKHAMIRVLAWCFGQIDSGEVMIEVGWEKIGNKWGKLFLEEDI